MKRDAVINAAGPMNASPPAYTVLVDNEGFRHTGDADASLADDAVSVSSGDLGVIELAPLPGFPVQRDLIADIDQMLDQIRKLKPYLQANNELATTKDGKINAFEYLQNPQQLAKYELLTNCIACGTCEGSCPVYAPTSQRLSEGPLP